MLSGGVKQCASQVSSKPSLKTLCFWQSDQIPLIFESRGVKREEKKAGRCMSPSVPSGAVHSAAPIPWHSTGSVARGAMALHAPGFAPAEVFREVALLEERAWSISAPPQTPHAVQRAPSPSILSQWGLGSFPLVLSPMGGAQFELGHSQLVKSIFSIC